ncbi:hypothetical protein ElyMa_000208600 [Elysia marginata]|uniref:Uncharacterized protein n=1 Tax=Elysia marginata TaxID=1093978 RepID=A0AAV4EYQ9_9GAST|nr:hypothetical protein ElyMa_000208600 [Elysia marginata]
MDPFTNISSHNARAYPVSDACQYPPTAWRNRQGGTAGTTTAAKEASGKKDESRDMECWDDDRKGKGAGGSVQKNEFGHPVCREDEMGRKWFKTTGR